MTAEEMATRLAAEQDGCLIVAHVGPWEEEGPFKEGQNWLHVPLLIVGPATRADYERQSRRATEIDGLGGFIDPAYTHFYRVVAAD